MTVHQADSGLGAGWRRDGFGAVFARSSARPMRAFVAPSAVSR